MSTTITPNMNLIVPTAGQEPGTTYATDINSSLSLIDAHDHTPGNGVQITPAGLNINTDLTLNSNSLTDATSIVFTASVSALTTPMSLSVAPGGESPQQQDLWFTPDTGVPIQITKNGQVNVVASSIDGETYAAGTFYWTQAQDSLPTTPANFDIGSVTIRPNTALTTNGVVLGPPSGISSQYNVQLPLLPASQKIMTLDSSGNMSAPYTVDGSTITISSNVIGVPAGGITNTQIANATITGSKLVNQTIGYDQLAPGFNGTWNSQSFTISASFAVRVATTANGTLATAFANGQTVDGVTLATNDIILLKNQTSSTEDGVYVVQSAGAPVRHTSYDTYSELNYAGVTVTAGTTNAGTNWFQNNILTSLADPQSWSRSQNFTWTVPSNVNRLVLKMAAGGGGGGGGGGSSGGIGGGGGGGGGAGDVLVTSVDVTAGEAVAVLVGAGGFSGKGTSAGNPGTSGTSGSSTTVTFSTSPWSFSLTGGGGGGGSGANASSTTFWTNGTSTGATSAGGGGGAGGFSNYPVGLATANGGNGSTGTASANPFGGGGGGGGENNGAGGAGGKSQYCATQAAGGSGAAGHGGGGGGGGGSGFAAGGAGGNGSGAGGTLTGSPGTANSGSGGGGGGGHTGSGSAAGSNGGAGANGIVVVYWLGAPS